MSRLERKTHLCGYFGQLSKHGRNIFIFFELKNIVYHSPQIRRNLKVLFPLWPGDYLRNFCLVFSIFDKLEKLEQLVRLSIGIKTQSTQYPWKRPVNTALNVQPLISPEGFYIELKVKIRIPLYMGGLIGIYCSNLRFDFSGHMTSISHVIG